MQLPDAAVGSILAATIAGLVVFISTVLSKEQKTSEFRQVWIDELRQDISQYISGATEFATFYHLKKNDDFDELKFLEDNFKLIHELQAIEHRITLRLNPKEHSDLIIKFKSFRKSMVAICENGGNSQLEASLTDALLGDVKNVLKDEWERVKRGEPAFRLVKWIAVIVAGAFGVFLLSFLVINLLMKPTIVSPQNIAKLPESPSPNGNNQSVQVIIDNSRPEGRIASKFPTSVNSPPQINIPKIFHPTQTSDCKDKTTICNN